LGFDVTDLNRSTTDQIVCFRQVVENGGEAEEKAWSSMRAIHRLEESL
jgi:hypothetical protein